MVSEFRVSGIALFQMSSLNDFILCLNNLHCDAAPFERTASHYIYIFASDDSNALDAKTRCYHCEAMNKHSKVQQAGVSGRYSKKQGLPCGVSFFPFHEYLFYTR